MHSLAKFSKTIFDPNLVDIFKQVALGEDLSSKILSRKLNALIVDDDPEDTTVLEFRLIERGFETKSVRTAEAAHKQLEADDFALVISEVDLEVPEIGLALGERWRQHPSWAETTWVVLSKRGEKSLAQRAFELGADDFVSKPVAYEAFAEKLKQLVERRGTKRAARGVSGQLSEMAFADVVQILYHGRRTCVMRLLCGEGSGELYFIEGKIVHAVLGGLVGEEAFYRMITLSDGDFQIEQNVVSTAKTIAASPDALLLEAMRRLDETSSGKPRAEGRP